MTCIFIYLCLQVSSRLPQIVKFKKKITEVLGNKENAFLQIVLKWIFFWVRPEIIFGQLYPGSHCAPSLLVSSFSSLKGFKDTEISSKIQIGLINMFMFKDRAAGFVQFDKVNFQDKDAHD